MYAHMHLRQRTLELRREVIMDPDPRVHGAPHHNIGEAQLAADQVPLATLQRCLDRF